MPNAKLKARIAAFEAHFATAMATLKQVFAATNLTDSEKLAIIEKGLKLYPDDLQLKMMLAYNYSYYHRQPEVAGRILAEASRLPGAPGYLPKLATRLFAQAGRFQSGLDLAISMRDSAGDPETRAFFDGRVQEIKLEETLVAIEAAWKTFRDREGRAPIGLSELVARGDIADFPIDPMGGKISIAEDGTASSTSARRLRVFDPTSQEQ